MWGVAAMCSGKVCRGRGEGGEDVEENEENEEEEEEEEEEEQDEKEEEEEEEGEEEEEDQINLRGIKRRQVMRFRDKPTAVTA
jgi:hypothetical protein